MYIYILLSLFLWRALMQHVKSVGQCLAHTKHTINLVKIHHVEPNTMKLTLCWAPLEDLW